jgi:cytochrome c biogenesis protein CcmG, thiol:disulfide interchange protein DsbE
MRRLDNRYRKITEFIQLSCLKQYASGKIRHIDRLGATIDGSSYASNTCKRVNRQSGESMIMFTSRHWRWCFAGVLIMGSMFIVATRVQPPDTTAASAAVADVALTPAPLADHPAPGFSLANLNGTNTALIDLKGQVLLINVWATWCPPCRVEMPSIQAAYEQYHDQGFTVLAVNLQEDPAVVAAFMRDYQLTFPALLDRNGQVSRTYQAVALPSSFFVDRRGVIRAVYRGPMPRSTIVGTVEQLLQEGM